MTRIAAISVLTLLIAGCSTRSVPTYHGGSGTYPKRPAKTYNHVTMRPYTVHGRRYYPTVVRTGEIFNGRASWYGPKFHGRLTSNGETYNMYDLTAAHKTLPMNTVVRVTNRNNGKSTIVRINDRGPFVANRIIDLSKKAASNLGMIGTGTAPVRLEILGFAEEGTTRIADLKALKRGPKEKVMASFAVQIGSFRRIEGAVFTQEKYDNTEGYRTIIKDTEYNGERLFRVWLTGFKSEAEARDFKASGPFAHAFIVRE
jgi:rare lipoprotein A